MLSEKHAGLHVKRLLHSTNFNQILWRSIHRVSGTDGRTGRLKQVIRWDTPKNVYIDTHR
jgi:hypothetical protein